MGTPTRQSLADFARDNQPGPLCRVCSLPEDLFRIVMDNEDLGTNDPRRVSRRLVVAYVNKYLPDAEITVSILGNHVTRHTSP